MLTLPCFAIYVPKIDAEFLFTLSSKNRENENKYISPSLIIKHK